MGAVDFQVRSTTNWQQFYNCLLQVGHQSLWLFSFTVDDEILLDEWKSLGGCSHFFAIAILKETFGKRSLTYSQMSGTSLTIEISLTFFHHCCAYLACFTQKFHGKSARWPLHERPVFRAHYDEKIQKKAARIRAHKLLVMMRVLYRHIWRSNSTKS